MVMILRDWFRVEDVNQTQGKRKCRQKSILTICVNKPIVFSNTRTKSECIEL